MLRLFKGTCQAVSAMHDYRGHAAAVKQTHPKGASSRQPQGDAAGRHSEDDERFPQPEGDGDGGYSYDSGVNVPLVTRLQPEDEGDVVFDGDQEQQNAEASTGAGRTEVVPYAHRDLKPG